MLKKITIKNYALIEDASIAFNAGFTVITGETGAGKSILLDALGLLLGNRADSSALRDQEKKCVVEAVFDLSAYQFETFFEENELEYEIHTIIRREVSNNGKSRAFVNDSPVVLSTLKLLGEKLIDIHAQNAALILESEAFYFDLLDGFSGVLKERNAYSKAYLEFRALTKQLQTILENKSQKEKELDFKTFQLNEIKAANLKVGEQEELEKELELLANAEDIQQKLATAVQVLNYQEPSLLSELNKVAYLLHSLEKLGAPYDSLSQRVSSLSIELKDINSELEIVASKVELDPQRLLEVEQRIALLEGLLKKYRIENLSALLAFQDQLEQELLAVEESENTIEKLQVQIAKQEAELKNKAKELCTIRTNHRVKLQQEVLKDLSEMNMKNSQLEISIQPQDSFNLYGSDEIKFLFNANKGGVLQALNKVASGGEFSRIMLSLKRVLSEQKSLPTILFDEIDTGVSGEVAAKMAEIMRLMAKRMQVIAITHLPQIASKGEQHLKVFKVDQENSTSSHIVALISEERVKEIAQMLSGSNITPAALANAKELLKS